MCSDHGCEDFNYRTQHYNKTRTEQPEDWALIFHLKTICLRKKNTEQEVTDIVKED